jgi:uncharacterized membrane protein YhaH (DUF805 family)
MSFGEAVNSGFENFANFSDRASRAAYWWWFLFGVLVSIATNIIDAVVIDAQVLTPLAGLVLLIPNLSVGVRRLHDTGRSGWWILIGLIPIIGWIVLLIFLIEQGDAGDNEYGPPPPDRGPVAAAPAA